jgi:hypothetical protein
VFACLSLLISAGFIFVISFLGTFNSSSQLKRLGLVRCYGVSEEGLNGVAAKLPLLEELAISYCSLSNEALEAVGRCCPHLKSLKFNVRRYRHGKYDEEAFAIAANMSELRHLQLVGNKLTNEGLQAILDGCPHLESLDIRQCFNLTLAGDLGRRCAQQIKHLRLPHDSTDDFECNDYSSLDCLFGWFSDMDNFSNTLSLSLSLSLYIYIYYIV